MYDGMELALDARRFLDQMQVEINRTRQGHWHPDNVPCDDKCPMNNPASRAVFRREIDLAMRTK
jgi:hypothetical protein